MSAIGVGSQNGAGPKQGGVADKSEATAIGRKGDAAIHVPDEQEWRAAKHGTLASHPAIAARRKHRDDDQQHGAKTHLVTPRDLGDQNASRGRNRNCYSASGIKVAL